MTIPIPDSQIISFFSFHEVATIACKNSHPLLTSFLFWVIKCHVRRRALIFLLEVQRQQVAVSWESHLLWTKVVVDLLQKEFYYTYKHFVLLHQHLQFKAKKIWDTCCRSSQATHEDGFMTTTTMAKVNPAPISAPCKMDQWYVNEKHLFVEFLYAIMVRYQTSTLNNLPSNHQVAFLRI